MRGIRLGLSAALVMIAPAVADEFPWCVELDMFTKNCAYVSHDECVKVAENAVSPATGKARCVSNPSYVAPVKTKALVKQAVKPAAKSVAVPR